MRFNAKILLGGLCTLFASVVFTNSALAAGKPQYEVTITNVTKAQSFTPQLVVTHDDQVSLFTLGEPASLPVEIVAEAGDTGPLTAALEALGNHVQEVTTIPVLLGPGETISVTVEANGYRRYLSAIAMLIPTNDTFFAVNALRLPAWGEVVTHSVAYDAGTELNDQNCANIPGPHCGGAAHSPGPNAGDEGFVYISNGMHDLGEADADGNEILDPYIYDWRNPVAIIKVRRVK